MSKPGGHDFGLDIGPLGAQLVRHVDVVLPPGVVVGVLDVLEDLSLLAGPMQLLDAAAPAGR